MSNNTVDLFSIPLEKADGTFGSLNDFKGKAILIVNVASKCGYTNQYKTLQKLHENFSLKGLQILAFPANEFGGQEPGTNEEIQTFCELNYGVTFPVFAKLIVKGAGQHPLYQFLTHAFPNLSEPASVLKNILRKIIYPGNWNAEVGDVKWNFEKFLLNREGEIIGRFPSGLSPDDPNFIQLIEATLG